MFLACGPWLQYDYEAWKVSTATCFVLVEVPGGHMAVIRRLRWKHSGWCDFHRHLSSAIHMLCTSLPHVPRLNWLVSGKHEYDNTIGRSIIDIWVVPSLTNQACTDDYVIRWASEMVPSNYLSTSCCYDPKDDDVALPLSSYTSPVGVVWVSTHNWIVIRVVRVTIELVGNTLW